MIDGIFRKDVVHVTIKRWRGIGCKMVKMTVDGIGSGVTTLTLIGGNSIKIKRSVRQDMGFGKNVIAVCAYGIDAETIIESKVGVEQIIDGTGRVIVEMVIGNGKRVYCCGERDSRW